MSSRERATETELELLELEEAEEETMRRLEQDEKCDEKRRELSLRVTCNFPVSVGDGQKMLLFLVTVQSEIPIPYTHTHTHTHPFNGPMSGTTQVSQYQKGKTNLDFTGARDSEWQWHQLGHMQVCTLLQTDNHASTSLLSFYRPDALPAAQPTVSKH